MASQVTPKWVQESSTSMQEGPRNRKFRFFSPTMCGICENDETDTYWVNNVTNRAHKTCLKKIQPLDHLLCDYIYNTCTDPTDTNLAHQYALSVIKSQIGKDNTILTYLEKNGQQALTDIYLSPDLFKKIEEAFKRC